MLNDSFQVIQLVDDSVKLRIRFFDVVFILILQGWCLDGSCLRLQGSQSRIYLWVKRGCYQVVAIMVLVFGWWFEGFFWAVLGWDFRQFLRLQLLFLRGRWVWFELWGRRDLLFLFRFGCVWVFIVEVVFLYVSRFILFCL